MIKNKVLDKIIDQAVEASFKDNKLLTNKVAMFVKDFRKLPLSEAIYALSVYKKGIERESKRTTVVVESATFLDKGERSQVTKKLKDQFLIYDLRFETNPSLLGGIQVKIGDTVLDYSVKNSIRQLKERMVNG